MRRRLGFLNKALEKLDQWLSGLSKTAILVGTLGLGLLIGALDRNGSTGLLIFYLAPIALAAWYGGKREAAVIAIYGATAWFLAVAYGTGFSEVRLDALWSFAARLLMFLVLGFALADQRETMRQQQELSQYLVHDLRAPISSAISGLETLQQTTQNKDPLDEEMVSLALISNQRALRLVNSLLDISKLERGRMKVSPEKTDLAGLVDQCFGEIGLWAKTNEVELVKQVHVPEAETDKNLTGRILVNLLSNAIKFSPPKSQVVVSVDSYGVAQFKISVQDQGPGIPAEYLPTIFDAFTQVKGTHGGTGLGLTFCKLAANAQGGKIWVESTLGKGTTMQMSLPLHGKSVTGEDA